MCSVKLYIRPHMKVYKICPIPEKSHLKNSKLTKLRNSKECLLTLLQCFQISHASESSRRLVKTDY